MKGFREKCENLHFGAFWAKMANFGQFLAKMGETGFFFKKGLGPFFPPLQALTNCKVQKKVMNGFRDISGRTNGRMRAKFKVLTN